MKVDNDNADNNISTTNHNQLLQISDPLDITIVISVVMLNLVKYYYSNPFFWGIAYVVFYILFSDKPLFGIVFRMCLL